jgi:hypothetical protein
MEPVGRQSNPRDAVRRGVLSAATTIGHGSMITVPKIKMVEKGLEYDSTQTSP